jgi:hypothetical protein
MESNIVINSKDRSLFGVTIKQETKTGFLSVTELQRAYEIARWQYGWSERDIKNIMQTIDFKERVFYLLQNQGVIKVSILTFMKMIEKEGIAKVLKGLGVYKTTGARTTKCTFTNPYIWILLAMELNPMIYATVVTWLTDSLIFDRIEAGDEFRPMNTAIKSIIINPDYRKYSIAINEKVFGRHLTGMRNLASAKELRKITKIEQFISQGINMKMIRDDNQIMYSISNFSL